VLAVAALVAAAGSSAATSSAGTVRHRPDGRDAPAFRHGPSSGHVEVDDVLIAVPGQPALAAYVVRPGGVLRPHAAAGVLFLHWLGDLHNDRSEYLAEATQLAGRGVVSVLPQGYFPWVPNPDGTAGDVTLVTDQVSAFRSALNHLAGLREVDRSRIALVGHDYGAMYGALLADQDRRVSAAVFEAPDATWSNWFATYWLGLEGDARAAYDQLFDGLDPVEHTARLGSHVLFQWAGRDIYVTPEVRAAYAASSPAAKVLLYDRAEHQLTDAAQTDRDAFLAEQLHLPPA
jgi:dienelactone hydrolase